LIQMHVETEYGSGLNPYHNTIINSTIDGCAFLNGTDNNNPIARWFVDMITDSVPRGFYHPCPYSGELKAYNVTLKFTNLISQFPKGSYKTTVRAFNKLDDNIITMKLDLNVN
jgi:hypothetical protein